MRKVLILAGVKADFSNIKRYVQQHFGDGGWREVNQEFKAIFQQIAVNPMLGTSIDELAGLGFENFRKAFVRQTRVVYEYDSQQVIVHMLIHTKRDFTNHLAHRLLS